MSADASVGGQTGVERTSRWTRADWLAFALIVACTIALSLPSLGRPLSASHDGKSGLIVRQMVNDGRWFVDDLDVGWVNKPPLFYWMGAGISRLTGGVSEWSVRLPSVFACALTAGLVFALGRALYGRRAGILAAAVLATTVHFHLLAQATRLDSMVMLSVLGAVLGYYRALTAPGGARSRASFGWAAFGHAFIAIGVLSKGPVAVLFAGLVMLGWLAARRVTREGALADDLRRLHLVLGALLVLGMTAPVFWAMDRASHGRFLGYFVLREHLVRAGVVVEDMPEFHRSYSFFFYFATLWFGAAPWSLFLPAGFVLAWRQRVLPAATRLLPVLYFALPFLFLSAVPYKKWAYLMTVYPAIALMCGLAWDSGIRGLLGSDRATRVLLRVAAGALLLAAAGTALFSAAVMRPEILGAVAGPEGLIHAKRALALPGELEAVRGRVWGAAAPLAAGAVFLAALAVMLWRRRTAPVMAILLALVIGGVFFDAFVIRPAEEARESLKPFAERVSAHVTETPGPRLILCVGELYELPYYLSVPVESIRANNADAFLARLEPAGSDAGEAVRVILPRKWFARVEARAGKLDVLLETGPGEAVKDPMKLVSARLRPEPGPPSGADRGAVQRD